MTNIRYDDFEYINAKGLCREMLKDSLEIGGRILWRNAKRLFGEILKDSLEKC